MILLNNLKSQVGKIWVVFLHECKIKKMTQNKKLLCW